MRMRSFSLNDPEASEALRSPPDPRAWGPQLSRNSRWGGRSDPVAVIAGNEVEAEDAFAEWQRHVDAVALSHIGQHAVHPNDSSNILSTET